MLFMLKSCPKCQGDMFVDKDEFDYQMKCLQCSYSRELENWPEMEKRPDRKESLAALCQGNNEPKDNETMVLSGRYS